MIGYQQRESDLPEFLEIIGPVYTGGFVNIPFDALQGRQEHDQTPSRNWPRY